ncbi:hypothetical protein U1Q18_037114, partial [Sarracenia purpurea var. burkii]
ELNLFELDNFPNWIWICSGELDLCERRQREEEEQRAAGELDLFGARTYVRRATMTGMA